MFTRTTARHYPRRHFALWLVICVIGVELGVNPVPCTGFISQILANLYLLFFFIGSALIVIARVNITFIKFRRKHFLRELFRQTCTLSFLFSLAAALSGLLFFYMIGPADFNDDFVQNGQKIFEKEIAVYPYCLSGRFQNWCCESVVLVLFCAVCGIVSRKLCPESKQRIALKNILRFRKWTRSFTRLLVDMFPVGIFIFSVLISYQLRYYFSDFNLPWKYLLILVFANIFLVFFVTFFLRLRHKISPLLLFLQILPAALSTLFTKNSLLNMPLTLYFMEKQAKNREVPRFVIPLCSFINMNSGVIFTVVTLLIILQNHGYAVNILILSGVVFFAMATAVLSAGNSMGIFFLNLCLLLYFGAPVNTLCALFPAFLFLMGLGAWVNVWSDSCICAALEKKYRQNHRSGE